MNAAEHHIGAAFASHFSNFVSPQRIGGVYADADDIPGLNIELDLQHPGFRPPDRDRQSLRELLQPEHIANGELSRPCRKILRLD